MLPPLHSIERHADDLGIAPARRTSEKPLGHRLPCLAAHANARLAGEHPSGEITLPEKACRLRGRYAAVALQQRRHPVTALAVGLKHRVPARIDGGVRIRAAFQQQLRHLVSMQLYSL